MVDTHLPQSFLPRYNADRGFSCISINVMIDAGECMVQLVPVQAGAERWHNIGNPRSARNISAAAPGLASQSLAD